MIQEGYGQASMKIIFFSYFFPPDLSAGAFRAKSIAISLGLKLKKNDVIHVITAHPHRYSSHIVKADDYEEDENITIHRIKLPDHNNNIVHQVYSYFIFLFSAIRISNKLKPSFYIVTTGRLMSGVFTYFLSLITKKRYFIDMRDIFSEAISDLVSKKNKMLGKILLYFISLIEDKVLRNASGVNIVSEGFLEYFNNRDLNTSAWSIYTNGIDKEFIGLTKKYKSNSSIKTILYAGNIGSGQGLEKIIPQVAEKLGDGYLFLVVGDGNTKHLLEEKIKLGGFKNIELLPPVGRFDLIEYYLKADILFLHLNNIPAFGRFLPSKIFEYAAVQKPIVAGLHGYSKKFMEDYIPQAFTFKSEDIKKAISCIKKAEIYKIDETACDKFIQKFSRVEIMDRMSDHLARIIYKKV